jgi:hypothetical protein
VMMEVLRGGEGDDPKARDKRPDGEDPFADGAVVNGEGGALADAEDLAAKTDGHEDDANREGEPGQGHWDTFLPYRT